MDTSITKTDGPTENTGSKIEPLVFNPWTICSDEKSIYLTDVSLWDEMIELNDCLADDEVLDVNVTEDIISYQNHLVIKSSDKRLLFRCGCQKIHYQSTTPCPDCHRYPYNPGIYSFKEGFYNLVDRTPKLLWWIHTHDLYDAYGSIVPPKVPLDTKCKECESQEPNRHFKNCPNAFRKNLIVVVHVPVNFPRDQLERHIVKNQPLQVIIEEWKFDDK